MANTLLHTVDLFNQVVAIFSQESNLNGALVLRLGGIAIFDDEHLFPDHQTSSEVMSSYGAWLASTNTSSVRRARPFNEACLNHAFVHMDLGGVAGSANVASPADNFVGGLCETRTM